MSTRTRSKRESSEEERRRDREPAKGTAKRRRQDDSEDESSQSESSRKSSPKPSRSRDKRRARSPSHRRERDKEKEKRRTRSRSRRADRDRERDREQRRVKEDREVRDARERVLHEQRQREREQRAEDRGDNEPTATLVVSGIPEQGVIENRLEAVAWDAAVRAGSSMPNGVRFMNDPVTQKFRGIAHVEFPHKEAAQLFKEHTKGFLEVDSFKLFLKFMHPPGGLSRSRSNSRSKDEPSVTLTVKGLSASTTEDQLTASFHPYVPKDLRHFPSRGFAFVQFNTVQSSETALAHFEREGKKGLEGHRVSARYAKDREDRRLMSAEGNFQQQQAQASEHATAELEKLSQQQAQAENTTKALSGVNAEMWANYMQSVAQTQVVKKDTNTFKYDAESGYYLDTAADLFYDPDTTYFFTTDYKDYFVYDHTVKLLCGVDDDGNLIPGGLRRALPSMPSLRAQAEAAKQVTSHPSRRSPSPAQGHRRGASPDKKEDGKSPWATWFPSNLDPEDAKPIIFPGGDPLAKLAPALPKADSSEPKKKRKRGDFVMGLAEMPNAVPPIPGPVTARAVPGPVTVYRAPPAPPTPAPSVPVAKKATTMAVAVPGIATPAPSAHSTLPLALSPLSPAAPRLNFSVDQSGVRSVVPPGDDDAARAAAAARAAIAQFSAIPAVSASMRENMAVVSGGEWICELCMRKFNSQEGLQRHEQLSDLHKQNLAKLEAANAGS